MNSSRTSLILTLSSLFLLLACFNAVSCNFADGNVYAVETSFNGQQEWTHNVEISSGGQFSGSGITVKFAEESDNSLTVESGDNLLSRNVVVKITKLSGDAGTFTGVTVVGSDFDTSSGSAQVSAFDEITVSIPDSVCTTTVCSVDVIVQFANRLVNISSVSPSQIHPAGAPITIRGSGFAPSSAAPVVQIHKSNKVHECVVIEYQDDVIVCQAPVGTGKGYSLSVNAVNVIGTHSVTYGEPYVTGTHTTYGEWATFIHISGGNFNPNFVEVDLSQSSKKRGIVNPICLVIDATTTSITCSTTGLILGPISAVVTTNGVSVNSRPKVIGTVVKNAQSSSRAECVPPAGTPDIYQTDMCNCWSGYAPSDESKTDCNTHAKCAQKLLADQDFFGSDIPQQPTTTFESDTLIIKQNVGIVQNRRSSFIRFAVPLLNHTLPALAAGTAGAVTCNYPGELWTKSINSLDCLEVFEAKMPWSQNQFCGFVQDLDATKSESDSTHIVYKSVLVTKFIEIYRIDNVLSQRVSEYSYQIHVSFMAQKLFTSNAISVFLTDSSEVGFVKVAITSDAVYDVASGNVLVSFFTTAAWPYALTPEAPTFKHAVPTINGVSAEISNVDYGIANKKCDTEQDSECIQRWFVRINVGTNCDIAGVYTFEDSLLCRDVNTTEDMGACPGVARPPVEYSIRIKSTNLCDPDALDATKELELELSAFIEEELATPSDVFQTGDAIFWKLTVVNPQGTIDRIAFREIRVEHAESGEIDFLLANTNVTATGAQVGLTTVELNQILDAGKTASLTFGHKLWRSALINTVGTLTSATGVNTDVAIRTAVIVDIWYHGNQKRSVELSATQASKEHTVRVINNGADETSQQLGESLNNLLNSSASSVVGSFALFVLSMAYLMM